MIQTYKEHADAIINPSDDGDWVLLRDYQKEAARVWEEGHMLGYKSGLEAAEKAIRELLVVEDPYNIDVYECIYAIKELERS